MNAQGLEFQYSEDATSLSSFRSSPESFMALGSTFLDPIHGAVTLESILMQIIDTPEFQRLARIAQLASCSLVYRGATHTRFSHSIGVCHLSGKVLDTSECTYQGGQCGGEHVHDDLYSFPLLAV